MKLKLKSAKKLFSGKNMGGVFFLLAVMVAGLALASYSTSKGSYPESVNNQGHHAAGGALAHQLEGGESMHLGPQPGVSGNSTDDNFVRVPPTTSQNPSIPGCAKKASNDNPGDLLPRPSNNQFSAMQPSGGLAGVNLLKAGYHIGVDTVGQTLRNANLQIRSEPPNPQMNVGPWLNTTIEPDLSRRPLEIGQGAQ